MSHIRMYYYKQFRWLSVALSLSIFVAFSLSLSLSLSLCVCVCVCIDLHLRLVRLTFFSPFLFGFIHLHKKCLCSSAGETFAPNAQEQLGFPLHPISGIYVHIYTYIHIYTHTHTSIYIYIYMPTRCASTIGFPSPFNIWYTHICVYMYKFDQTLKALLYTLANQSILLGFGVYYLHSVSNLKLYTLVTSIQY